MTAPDVPMAEQLTACWRPAGQLACRATAQGVSAFRGLSVAEVLDCNSYKICSLQRILGLAKSSNERVKLLPILVQLSSPIYHIRVHQSFQGQQLGRSFTLRQTPGLVHSEH